MRTSYNLITQANLHQLRRADDDANIVNYSEVCRGDFEQIFRGYSVKFVLEGEETYVVNGREHRVGAGQYLLTNPLCRGTGHIASVTPVRGLCIDLRPAVVAEVLTTRAATDPDWRPDLSEALEGVHFYVHRFAAERTALGRLLARLGPAVGTHALDDPSSVYVLAEGYLASYGAIVRQLDAVDAVRLGTRQELHRRLERGREFIEANFAAPIAVADIARAAHLSTYRFFRLFRQVYGQSPHQFILHKRLAHGRALLASGQYSVTEVALRTGFADIFSFSKAYKKRYGGAPTYAVEFSAGFDKQH